MSFEGRETQPSSGPISSLGQPLLPEQSCTRHSSFTRAAQGQAPFSLFSAADGLVQGHCLQHYSQTATRGLSG